MSLQSLKLFGQLRIADLIVVKISNGDAHAMFHFAFAEIVQERSPLLVFFEVFSDVLRKENVPGVTAIHHPLRDVEASTGEIGVTVHINHAADWATVDAHSKL